MYMCVFYRLFSLSLSFFPLPLPLLSLSLFLYLSLFSLSLSPLSLSQRIDQLIHELDPNGSGVITFENFRRGIETYLLGTYVLLREVIHRMYLICNDFMKNFYVLHVHLLIYNVHVDF